MPAENKMKFKKGDLLIFNSSTRKGFWISKVVFLNFKKRDYVRVLQLYDNAITTWHKSWFKKLG